MTFMSPLLPLPMPLAPLAWLTGLRRVPDNSVVTVHRFGRFVRALGPGWRWTLPGLDQLGQPVCLIGHQLSVVGAQGAQAELYYQILDPALAGEALDDIDALVDAGAFISRVLGRPPASRAGKALLTRRAQVVAGASSSRSSTAPIATSATRCWTRCGRSRR